MIKYTNIKEFKKILKTNILQINNISNYKFKSL